MRKRNLISASYFLMQDKDLGSFGREKMPAGSRIGAFRLQRLASDAEAQTIQKRPATISKYMKRCEKLP